MARLREAELRSTLERCALGNHRPSRPLLAVEPGAIDSDVPHCRCQRCGRLLVKSPITRRWRPTGLLG